MFNPLENGLEYYAILTFAFLAVVAAVFSLYLLVSRRSGLAARLARLAPAANQTTAGEKPRLLDKDDHGLLSRISNPLHEVVAAGDNASRKRLRLKLIRAGLRSDKAYRTYLAAKVILGIASPGIYLATEVFYRLTPDMLAICIGLALTGFFLPDIYIWLLTRARQEAMEKALPDALDLMVVCVESGLGLDMTLKRVGDEIRPIDPNLSDELHLTNLEIRAGRSRDDSFRELALRTGISEVSNLMTILIQTSRFGTSLAKALRVHAEAMRIKRRQIAEEKAAKSSVKLLFPLIFFIFPAIFVVLVGPAALQIASSLLPALGGK